MPTVPAVVEIARDTINALTVVRRTSIQSICPFLISVMPDIMTPLRIHCAAIIITGLIAGLWRQGWMWTALGLMIVIGIVMNRVGIGYYRIVAGAAENALKNKDDTSVMDKFNAAKNTMTPEILSATGFVGGLIIVWLMMFK